MKISGDFVYRVVIVLSVLFYSVYFILYHHLQLEFERTPVSEVEHYTTCSRVGDFI